MFLPHFIEPKIPLVVGHTVTSLLLKREMLPGSCKTLSLVWIVQVLEMWTQKSEFQNHGNITKYKLPSFP